MTELHVIIMVLFAMMTIISITGYSISAGDTRQPNSICKEKMDNRRLQLVEESANNGENI